MPTELTCPYCGGQAVKCHSDDFGPYFACERYPACDARVGCHQSGHRKGTPLGTLANKELRNARVRLHGVVAPLWREIDGLYPDAGTMSLNQLRQIAKARTHNMIADRMGLHELHIAELDLQQCERAMGIAKTLTPAKVRAWAKARSTGGGAKRKKPSKPTNGRQKRSPKPTKGRRSPRQNHEGDHL